MPSVMVEGNQVKGDLVDCGHGGVVKTTGSPKLSVDGQGVLLAMGSIEGHPITGCGLLSPNTPCTVAGVIDPAAKPPKLFVDGVPVVLSPVLGTTNGALVAVPPPPPLHLAHGVSKQIKLTVT